MTRSASALIIVTILAGILYWLHGRDETIGRPCGGDFHVKPCPEGLVCVSNHPWSGGMGTSGTCQRPIPRDPSSATLPFPAEGSKLIPPLKETPSLAFNETVRTGGTSRGLAWEANPPAEIVSPGGGHVIHADDFRGYGNLVIIRSDGGYHFLIAGLSTLAVKNGDAVQPGTLLGTAHAKAVKPEGSDENARRTVRPAVYFELRKNGQPIDPSPWLSVP